MKLTLVAPYKSVTRLPEIELPDFVVLTGVNGAGKTHLIEAIENGHIQIDGVALDGQTKPIRLFNWTTLVPQDTGAFAPYQITQEIHGFWNELSQYRKEADPTILNALQQFNRLDLVNINPLEIIDILENESLRLENNTDEFRQMKQSVENAISHANQHLINRFQQNDPINRQRFIKLLQEVSSTPLIALRETEFYEKFPRSWQPIDMFQQSFGRLFADYQRNWIKTNLRILQTQKGSLLLS